MGTILCACSGGWTLSQPMFQPQPDASGIWTTWFWTLSALCWVTGSPTQVSSLTACSHQPCPPSSCLTSPILPFTLRWSLPTSLPASLQDHCSLCWNGNLFFTHSWLFLICSGRFSTRAWDVSTFSFETYLEKWDFFFSLSPHKPYSKQVRTENHVKKITLK